MNAVIDWRSYFRGVPDHSVYAKDAKGVSEAREDVPFADLHTNIEETPSLEDVLKGNAIELWSDARGERFWLVADEADAVMLGEPRGTVYTAAEARRVIQIGDPATVAEIHQWKRQFDATIDEYRPASHEETKLTNEAGTRRRRGGSNEPGGAGPSWG